tara:strand:- start:5017 stop:5763 length:747 start_codon:yes stop_codon:yes gene_type:complete
MKRTDEIKRGNYNPYYPISQLKMAEVNRDIFLQHAHNFKDKLNVFGWMMPIVVSKSGDVIEGHHRIESAKLLNQETVPAYVVDWINTSEKQDHLDCIINLNNGNRAWLNADYLKAFSKENNDYLIVYNAFLKYGTLLSVGNVINCFFGKSISKKFKKGECKINNLELAIYLLDELSTLVKKYGKSKIQAYTIRELISLAYLQKTINFEFLKDILNIYEDMAQSDHPKLTSISEFRPHIMKYANMLAKK